jgi:hypothetical protein
MYSHCFFVRLIEGSGYERVLQMVEVKATHALDEEFFPVRIASAHLTAAALIDLAC